MTKKNNLSTVVRSKFHYFIWAIILFFICAVMINILLVSYLFNFNTEGDRSSSNNNQSSSSTLEENNTSKEQVNETMSEQIPEVDQSSTNIQESSIDQSNFGEEDIESLIEIRDNPLEFQDFPLD